jgi:hypothetical protein
LLEEVAVLVIMEEVAEPVVYVLLMEVILVAEVLLNLL